MSTLSQNNMNSKPIGFFDSGVGGLSVYSKFRKALPNENTLYFGDLAHLPYGNKSFDELVGYARNILNFYKNFEVKAVVIACNTSSAQAYDIVKKEFDFKIYPIIQSCAKVISEIKLSKIGVFATSATVKSLAYTKEIQKFNPQILVNEIACPDWVEIVEGGLLSSDISFKSVKKHLDEMMLFNPDKIILGCTHYPYLLNDLTKFYPKDKFIDPSGIFVDFIKSDLGLKLNQNDTIGYEKFFVSADAEKFVNNGKIFYEVKTLPEMVNLD